MKRCLDTWRHGRCTKPLGHDGLHHNGEFTWRFDNGLPEWRKRGEFRRDLTGVEA